MTRTRRTLLGALSLWAPPLALMAVIFALSAQPDLSSGLGTADLILRKIAHMAEYGLLVFLWWRALRTVAAGRAAVAAAVAIAVVYAASDEWHQSFVEGRHGTPVDVMIDAVGMAAVAWLILRRGSERG
ncbi:MAG TPA: VanZ family protein [Thermoleophilaceae bacterium]